MKILILVSNISQVGGVEKRIDSIIKSLREKGEDIRVISFFGNLSKTTFQNINAENCIVMNENCNSKNSRLRQEIKNFLPDVILNTSDLTNQFILLYKLRGFKKILRKNGSIYGDDLYYRGIKKMIRKVTTYFFHLLYDAVVVQNKSELELLRTKRKGVVIENFIELHNKPVYGDRENVIIAAGRIAQVKGFSKIPRIWNRIHNLFPDWKIEIWGPYYVEDPYYQEVLKQISTYGLEHSVVIKGPYHDADKTFQRGKIAVLTSETDCFPGVILEAMANEVPVVSFDAPFGPRNIIDDGRDGFLIRPDDYSGFAEKLKSLMGEDKLIRKMREAAYEKSLTFSPEVIMGKWIKLFNKFKKE